MLVQLAVGMILPVSHASAEAAELSHQEHIQAAGDEVCVPHADLTCQTCRVLGHHRLPQGGRLVFDEGCTSRSATTAAATTNLPGTRTFQPLGSRAPPVQ